MSERIMMHSGGAARPLTFDPQTNAPPLLASAGTPWAGPPVEVHALESAEYRGPSGPVDGECGLFVILDGELDIVVRKGKREIVRHAGPGYASFLSGDSRRTVVRVRGKARAAAVHVPREWFERLAFGGVPSTFGRTRPLVNDVTVRSLVIAMCDEVARGGATGRLYAESLSTALLSYALNHVSPDALASRGALSEAECRRIRVLVQERLGDDLSLEELSRSVGLGPRHFSRLFCAAFGTTPHRYVMRERLSEGARLLEQADQDVGHVALRVGFASQSHFTSAFHKAFGVTPSRFARKKRRTQPDR